MKILFIYCCKGLNLWPYPGLLSSYGCDKGRTKTDLGRKGYISAHVSWHEGSLETQGRSLEVETETEATSLLLMVCSVWIRIQPKTHLPRGGSAHSSLGLPKSVTNQENAPEACPHGSFFLKLLACVKLTKQANNTKTRTTTKPSKQFRPCACYAHALGNISNPILEGYYYYNNCYYWSSWKKLYQTLENSLQSCLWGISSFMD